MMVARALLRSGNLKVLSDVIGRQSGLEKSTNYFLRVCEAENNRLDRSARVEQTLF